MYVLAFATLAVSFDQILSLIGLVVNIIQALVLPVTIYLLVIQTRAMREQTTALVLQSKEMIEQTRVFTDTVYSATFQSLYDAEAHIGELMMIYPEAGRILMSPLPHGEERGSLESIGFTQIDDPALRERVRWLGTAMLDFYEHIWTQAQKRGIPKDVWEAWAEYMVKMLCETYLRSIWQAERDFYSAGFRHFIFAASGDPWLQIWGGKRRSF